MQVTKQMRTETGHRLVDYDGRCAHLHGHSYLWEVTVEGDLDHRGMVVDFTDLKRAMTKVLDPLDHCMILHRDKDPIAQLARTQGIPIHTILRPSNQDPEARIWLAPFNPTAENLVYWAAGQLRKHLSTDLILKRVTVWETANSYAVWES